MSYLHQSLFPVLSITVLLLSCTTGRNGGDAGLYGKPGEVLIVMPDKAWEGSPGDRCRDVFGSPYEVLPQYEPMFDLSHINFGSYRDFFLLHRNVVVASINPDAREAAMELKEDPLAPSQLVINLVAPDDSSLVALLSSKAESILNLFVNAERNRIRANNQGHANTSVTESIKSRFSISLEVPAEYQIVIDTTDFLWLQKETGSVIQGILIYMGKMTDLKEGPSVTSLISYRDEKLKRYVQGSVPGSYMTTEKEFAPVSTTYSAGNGFRAVEIRGLWRMENGVSMGGPFISLSRYHDQHAEFITADGFVFAAGFSKRNYMRELEAIISTME